jgi:flagellar assembly protein FliH
MSPRAKFMFDDDFASAGEKEADRAKSQAALEAAVADAEARGFRAGHAKALADTQVEVQRRNAAALERIGATLATMASGLNAIERRLEAEAVEVAVAVASKLAPELIAREPFAEISALAADCFNHLVGAPHVVVRVNDALYADARERVEETARMSGFDGRLVVLAEPDIRPGDCRIEWADGGLTRDRAATEAAIGEAVGRYVAARRDSES